MGMIWKDNLPHCDLCGVWYDNPCDCVYGELRHRITELEKELAWIDGLYSYEKTMGELSMDLYEASSTARRLINQGVTP